MGPAGDLLQVQRVVRVCVCVCVRVSDYDNSRPLRVRPENPGGLISSGPSPSASGGFGVGTPSSGEPV